MDNISGAIIMTIIVFAVAFGIAWLIRPVKSKAPMTKESLAIIHEAAIRQRNQAAKDYREDVGSSYNRGKQDFLKAYIERNKE